MPPPTTLRIQYGELNFQRCFAESHFDARWQHAYNATVASDGHCSNHLQAIAILEQLYANGPKTTINGMGGTLANIARQTNQWQSTYDAYESSPINSKLLPLGILIGV